MKEIIITKGKDLLNPKRKDYIKPEFEKLLGSAKNKFIYNLKRSHGDKYLDKLNEFNKYDSFYDFIICGFSWTGSMEGFEFWYQLARKK